MGTSTLHLNNPVPSNGAVATSLGGRHTVTATLSGVGAISCKVQAWGSEENTNSRMIGGPVTISGTTTVSQTLTFDAIGITQFWLAVIEITPASTFTATVENSGSMQFGGAVRAAGIQMVPGSVERHLRAESLGIDLHGASSFAQCHNPVGVVTRTMTVLATGAAADVGATWGGLLQGGLNQGCPLHVTYNSGVGAETTVQILDGMWTDLANPLYPNQHTKSTLLGVLSNDLPEGTDPTTLESVIDGAVYRLLTEFKREKVGLWMPHTRNPMPVGVTHEKYRIAQRMMRSIASRYRDRCRVFSAYDILNEGGIDTPAALIVDAFGHLNQLGGRQLSPLVSELAAWLGWAPPSIEETEFGTPIMRASGKGPLGQADGYSGAAAMTIAPGTDSKGRTRHLLTGTGAVGTVGRLWQRSLLNPARPVVEGRDYRVCVYDLETVATGTGANIIYQPGAAFKSYKTGEPLRRTRVGTFGGVTGLAVPVGARMDMRLSDIFTATQAMAEEPELIIYSGDYGYQIQCAHVDLLEVPD